MPSPIGHALGGVVFGWTVAGVPDAPGAKPATFQARLVSAARALLTPTTMLMAAVGVAPDLDFLFGSHSRQSHSVGAVFLVFLVALAVARWRPSRTLVAASGGPARFALACSCAYASHILLDWMGNDTTPPIGIMALWPFTEAFYQSNLFVFEAISRRWWLEGFFRHNALAVARELLILLPAVGLVLLAWRRRAAVGRPYRPDPVA